MPTNRTSAALSPSPSDSLSAEHKICPCHLVGTEAHCNNQSGIILARLFGARLQKNVGFYTHFRDELVIRKQAIEGSLICGWSRVCLDFVCVVRHSQGIEVGLSPGLRQTVKTLFAVRWKLIVQRRRLPAR